MSETMNCDLLLVFSIQLCQKNDKCTDSQRPPNLLHN